MKKTKKTKKKEEKAHLLLWTVLGSAVHSKN